MANLYHRLSHGQAVENPTSQVVLRRLKTKSGAKGRQPVVQNQAVVPVNSVSVRTRTRTLSSRRDRNVTKLPPSPSHPPLSFQLLGTLIAHLMPTNRSVSFLTTTKTPPKSSATSSQRLRKSCMASMIFRAPSRSQISRTSFSRLRKAL